MSLNECKVTKVEKRNITIHMVTSPEEGELVNSQIVETPKKLVVIDTPLLKAYGQEFREYADSLNKPIDRVFITHAHPDHWFCLSYFSDIESYALEETMAELDQLYELQIGYHKSIHAELLPDNIIRPANTVKEGGLTIDNVKFQIYKAINAEDNAMMIIGLPEIKTLLSQDLIYNRTYMYLATKDENGNLCIDNWIQYLQDFKTKGYETIIPGHGEPADPSIFDTTIKYLETAKGIIASSNNTEELVKQFTEKYPDYRIPLILQMTAFMFYEYGKDQSP